MDVGTISDCNPFKQQQITWLPQMPGNVKKLSKAMTELIVTLEVKHLTMYLTSLSTAD
jgi:hypothetical protein